MGDAPPRPIVFRRIAAREMLRFFTTPQAGEVLRSSGVEPFVE